MRTLTYQSPRNQNQDIYCGQHAEGSPQIERTYWMAKTAHMKYIDPGSALENNIDAERQILTILKNYQRYAQSDTCSRSDVVV